MNEMKIFVAFNISDVELVRNKLIKNYNGNFYDDGSSFFIATEGETTRQLATKIGLGEEEPSTRGIVVPVTVFWGRYNPEVWEWIIAKQRTNGR